MTAMEHLDHCIIYRYRIYIYTRRKNETLSGHCPSIAIFMKWAKNIKLHWLTTAVLRNSRW